jgi:flagellar basal body-associated protein FliL
MRYASADICPESRSMSTASKSSAKGQLWLAILGALVVLACVATGYFASLQLQRSSQSAFVAKDVVADVLPPPMYLIEMRLVLSQAVEASTPVESAAVQLARLEKEYRERVTYWQANKPEGLDKLLLGSQHDTAEAFIVGAKRVMKLVTDGNLRGASDELVKVHDLYLKHRLAVDATVKAGVDRAERSMTSFESTARAARVALVSMLVLGLLAMAGLGAMSLRRTAA